MKKFLSFSLVLGLFSIAALGQTTLWDGVVFNSPYTNSVIATSAEIANPSGFNSIKAVIIYDNITPDVCQCQITASIEEEIQTDVWIPIAPQNEVYGVEGNAPQRILVFGPQFVANPGTDLFIPDAAGGVRISDAHGVAPSNMRIRIVVENGALLTSTTLTGYVRLFNE